MTCGDLKTDNDYTHWTNPDEGAVKLVNILNSAIIGQLVITLT